MRVRRITPVDRVNKLKADKSPPLLVNTPDSSWLTFLLERRNVNKFADKEINDFSFPSSSKGSLHVFELARDKYFLILHASYLRN